MTDQPAHLSSNTSGSVVCSQHRLIGISKSLIAVFPGAEHAVEKNPIL